MILGGRLIVGSVLHAPLMLMFIRRIRGERVSSATSSPADFAVPLIIAGLLMSALHRRIRSHHPPGVYLAVGYVFALP